MIRTAKPHRLFRLWAALCMLAVAATSAQAFECEAEDRTGRPRDCTFTEEIGYCMWSAEDSGRACAEDADGFWEDAICRAAFVIDVLACEAGAPFELIGKIAD